MSRDDLVNWGVFEVRPRAKAAAEGCDEYHAGEWCRFCRASGQCKEQARQELERYEQSKRDPNLMSSSDYSNILPYLAELRKWADQVEEQALSRLLAGEDIPGYKPVEGRSVRQWSDQEAAFAAITAAGYDEALLWERRPLTLAAAEKVVGKAKFAEIAAPYIVTPPGKPTIAPITDKRPALNSAAADFAGVGQ